MVKNKSLKIASIFFLTFLFGHKAQADQATISKAKISQFFKSPNLIKSLFCVGAGIALIGFFNSIFEASNKVYDLEEELICQADKKKKMGLCVSKKSIKISTLRKIFIITSQVAPWAVFLLCTTLALKKGIGIDIEARKENRMFKELVKSKGIEVPFDTPFCTVCQAAAIDPVRDCSNGDHYLCTQCLPGTILGSFGGALGCPVCKGPWNEQAKDIGEQLVVERADMVASAMIDYDHRLRPILEKYKKDGEENSALRALNRLHPGYDIFGRY